MCVPVYLSVCVRERGTETKRLGKWSTLICILSSFMCLHVWFIHTLILDGMFYTSLSGLKEGIAHHPQVWRKAFHTCLIVTVILDRIFHTSPSGLKGGFALLCHSHTWWIVLHITLRYKEGFAPHPNIWKGILHITLRYESGHFTSPADMRVLHITLRHERGVCTSPSDMKGGFARHPHTWQEWFAHSHHP